MLDKTEHVQQGYSCQIYTQEFPAHRELWVYGWQQEAEFWASSGGIKELSQRQPSTRDGPHLGVGETATKKKNLRQFNTFINTAFVNSEQRTYWKNNGSD